MADMKAIIGVILGAISLIATGIGWGRTMGILGTKIKNLEDENERRRENIEKLFEKFDTLLQQTTEIQTKLEMLLKNNGIKTRR